QFQADMIDAKVSRAATQETTALGAAFLAGLAEDVWGSPATVNATWRADATFTPAMDAAARTQRRSEWSRAVERSRDWARE
ncbi:MAG TPA: glycerol kinase, partial [Acidimicrobiia bacterium]|nr:glycerol kinase [Acidimicrobiia bacterium]